MTFCWVCCVAGGLIPGCVAATAGALCHRPRLPAHRPAQPGTAARGAADSDCTTTAADSELEAAGVTPAGTVDCCTELTDCGHGGATAQQWDDAQQ